MSSPSFFPPPPPTAPTLLDERECCGRACDYCVWIYYHAAQQRYETAMTEWERRYGAEPN